MGLIENMGKKGRAGAKLPVPTTAGDDQVIAAKTGEYVLPPEVVAAIGVEKLNALVQSITGQAPGGEPAEMPEGAMHEMMEGEAEGYAKGGCVKGKGMQGYASGGLISKWDGVDVDPFGKQSLGKYSFGADGSALDDSVSRQIDRSAKGMMQSDEVFDAARPQIEERMRRQPNGLISQLMGYAEGGIVEDDYTRRKLSGYNPHQSIPKNATTNASPRAPELRNYAPEPGRLQSQPANTYTRMGTEPNAARAPELRNFTPEPGRVQPGATTPRISGLAATPPAGTPSATVRALDARVPGDAAAVEAQRAKAAAQAGRLTGQARSAAATAAQPPKPGLAGRAAQTAGRIGSLAKAATPFALNAGVNQSFADMDTGYRDAFAQSVGAESPLGNAAADTARTFANIGDAVTLGLAGRVGRGIASATGGGSFGEGFASDSDRDRFLAAKQPQQVAAAPQLTPQQNADEIARRRAALEGPQSSPATAPTATPTQAIASAPTPRKAGPVSGLAARAKAAPSAPAAAANVPPMDGAVEIIRGQNRSWAVPELGYQEVPDEVYRSGRIAEYQQAQSNNMLDRADPVAAELRTRLAEIAAQGDNSIRVSNATDRDGEGRGLRNAAARMELDLTKRALAGDPQAIQQLNLLRGKGGDDAQKERYKLIGDLAQAYQQNPPFDPATKQPIPFEDWAEPRLRAATGTVKSSSAAPQEGKTYTDAQGNKAIFRNGQWQEVR